MSDTDIPVPPTFYRVRNWDDLHENAQSRPLKYLRWLASPILINTSDYAELMDHVDGLAHFGLWKAFTELAAQCQPRGSLLKPGGVPHNQKSIALALRCSKEILQTAINRYLSLGWLEEVPFTKQGLSVPSDNQENSRESLQNSRAPLQKSTNNARAREQYSTGHNTKPPVAPLEGGPPPNGNHGPLRRPRGRSRTEELAQHIYDSHHAQQKEPRQ